MTLVDGFDRWVESGPFTSADLGIYRIVYAVCALFIVPNIGWLSHFPQFMFQPPPGPIQLFPGFPSPTVLVCLEVLRSAALILLGLGLWTRCASIAVAVLLVVTYGLTFSLGKVDHTILLVVAPLVLAFANWGDRFSLDSLRHPAEATPQRQWPLRLLALLIGWGFFAAALTKVLTGWLSFSSQAARGYFVLGYLTESRTFWLADWVAAHDVRPAWEVVDWLTVIFEASILIALPWWRAFRTTLAVAATFHLAVLLIMDIDFSHAVVAYGAFVSWASVGRRMRLAMLFRPISQLLGTPRTTRRAKILLWLFAAAIGCVAWALMESPGGSTPTGLVASDVVILLGAVIGSAYLVHEARALLAGRRRQAVHRGPRGSDNADVAGDG
ncbi:hypothetical protein ASD37_12970 [Mycobacterium sp. Root135]|nr:hypothetical protein ASD37_12970 [Mycobacterium sp. Root135]